MLQKIGFDLLEENDKKDFEKLFNEYSKKIAQKLKNVSSFVIHLKEYEKDGLRKKIQHSYPRCRADENFRGGRRKLGFKENFAQGFQQARAGDRAQVSCERRA